MADVPSPKGDELGALEQARRDLYAPQHSSPDLHAGLPEAPASSAPHAWERATPPNFMSKAHPHVRLASLFFFSALGFFVIAGGLAAYWIYFGVSSVSTNNITLEVSGPTTIAGGDTVPLSLTITNRNPTEITDAKLELNFPPGTRSADDVTEEYPRYTEHLGTLAPGQTITRSVKAILFGGEGQNVSIPVSLSYGTAGSNAVFVKKVAYDLAISSAPLSVSVVAPTQAVAGQTFSIDLTVRSNAVTPITNVVVVAQYPSGFVPADSPIQNGVITVGPLGPGETKSYTVAGTFTSAGSDQRTFHFSVGTSKDANTPSLAVTYMTQDVTVAIGAPFISTNLAINGNSGAGVVLAPGSRSTGVISYKNTLDSAITNAEIEVKLSGDAIDYNSIQASSGFYRSSDHTVVFNGDTTFDLDSIGPGESGLATFSFATLAAGKGSSASFTLSVSGTPAGAGNSSQRITASSIQTAKIASAPVLTARALHASGPYTNDGPIPPQANAATKYTIVWNIKNTSNAIADANVKATLPSYVSFTGQNSDGITYNAGSRTVSWNAGDLGAGASAQATFQISFTPSTTQRNTAPTLVNAATLSAFDRFAQIQITGKADLVTTDIVGDPGYVAGNGTVQ